MIDREKLKTKCDELGIETNLDNVIKMLEVTVEKADMEPDDGLKIIAEVEEDLRKNPNYFKELEEKIKRNREKQKQIEKEINYFEDSYMNQSLAYMLYQREFENNDKYLERKNSILTRLSNKDEALLQAINNYAKHLRKTANKSLQNENSVHTIK